MMRAILRADNDSYVPNSRRHCLHNRYDTASFRPANARRVTGVCLIDNELRTESRCAEVVATITRREIVCDGDNPRINAPTTLVQYCYSNANKDETFIWTMKKKAIDSVEIKIMK